MPLKPKTLCLAGRVIPFTCPTAGAMHFCGALEMFTKLFFLVNRFQYLTEINPRGFTSSFVPAVLNLLKFSKCLKIPTTFLFFKNR